MYIRFCPPRVNHRHGHRIDQTNVEDGGLSCGGLAPCKGRPPAQRSGRNDERPVAVPHVPRRPLCIRVRRRFPQWVAVGNRTVFRPPPPRTPSPNRHVAGQCRIERRPVDPRLPTGYDLSELHAPSGSCGKNRNTLNPPITVRFRQKTPLQPTSIPQNRSGMHTLYGGRPFRRIPDQGNQT